MKSSCYFFIPHLNIAVAAVVAAVAAVVAAVDVGAAALRHTYPNLCFESDPNTKLCDPAFAL